MEDAEEDEVIFEKDDSATARSKESQNNCVKMVITVVLCASFFGLGLCLAIPGPTLLDLEENTNSDRGHISLIFTSRSVGYLFGSILGGFLFAYINQSCLLSISMLVTAVATAAAPLCRQLTPLAIMIMLQGISIGFLDTGGNVLCLETWGRDNGPHLQALAFAFGFGAFLAPLLAAPFLHSRSSVNETTSETEESSQFNSTDKLADVSPVKYAYLMIAVYVALVSLAFLVLCCCSRKSSSSPTGSEPQKSDYAVRQEGLCFRIEMLTMLFIFFFFYVGCEVTYGSLISKFAIEMFGWSKRNAALLNSVFWGSFAGGRLVAIFLARRFEPTHLLVADLVVSSVSITGLAAVESIPEYLGHRVSSEVLLWIFSSTLGIGMASIFPSGISWVERYIKVSGKEAAIFIVGSALGEMVLPALTGYIFYHKGAVWLMYILLISLLASAVVFVVMWKLARGIGERYSKVANQEEEDMELLKVTDDDGLATLPSEFPNGIEVRSETSEL